MGRKRGTIDIEPEIAFICTRVKNNTVEDKAKMKRFMQLLKHTINDKRVMGTENPSQLCTWVDAAYGVQSYLKSHTSRGM